MHPKKEDCKIDSGKKLIASEHIIKGTVYKYDAKENNVGIGSYKTFEAHVVQDEVIAVARPKSNVVINLEPNVDLCLNLTLY